MRLTRHVTRVYATADPRSLAAGRIALALVLLVDLVRRVASMPTWYTNAGLLPNHMVLARPTLPFGFSFFYMASWPHEAALGFVICGVAYLALLFGIFTRIAHVASFLCVLSLHSRAVFIANGGDVVLGELCLWTMFLPTGRRYSMDAIRARSGDSAGVPPDTRPIVSLAVAALLLQLAFIYLFNALHKTGSTWSDGTAVHYVLHQSRMVTAFGLWARERLSFAALHALTAAARTLEWTLAALLLVPIVGPWPRRAAIAGMWILHLGFALFLNLSVFVPAMLAFTPNLLSHADWDVLERWRARLPRQAARAIERARAAFVGLAGLGRRFGPRGALSEGQSGRWRIARELPVAITMFFAANQLLAENPAVKAIVHVPTPAITEAAVSYLLLFEAWSMFAPNAPTTDMNVFVDALTVDGRRIDPLNQAANPRHPAPGAHIPDRLDQDAFFCDYLPRIVRRTDYHQAFIDWILRYADRTGRSEDRIVSFEAFSIEQDGPPPGESAPHNVRVTPFLKWPRK